MASRMQLLLGTMATCVAWAGIACVETSNEATRQELLSPIDDTGGLPALNVDLHGTSVSGLSAGAYMAVQFHVAYSSIMRGAAAFAGGPYFCAEGALNAALTTCMTGSPSPSRAIDSTRRFAAAGTIDDPAALAGQRVFVFGGASDTTVVPAVVDALSQYYRAFTDRVRYESRRPSTGHTMPTLDYGNDCSATAEPWIGRCNYDGAGIALQEIYGSLSPPATSLSGQFVTIDQAAFLPNPTSHSVATAGYAYIPQSCREGARCRVHVVFHGCKQYAGGSVGDRFYRHAGYNAWADTNQIVVLYPQTTPKIGSNPNGCWDWWGYDSPDYAKRSAPQMAMVRAMIDALARSGSVDGGAVDAGACFVANNYQHVVAGRAHVALGYALANGSNQNMGLYSVGIVTSLRRLSTNHYVVGNCP